MRKEADFNIVSGTGLTFWLQRKVEQKFSSLWISKDLRRIKTFTGHFSATGQKSNHHLNQHAGPGPQTHTFPHKQASFSHSLAAEYSQVVGESAEPGWDGGQPSPGAVCTPIFIAAARGRTNGRRLPLTGGPGTEEAPQTYPKQIHTHFSSLRFR